MKLYASSNVTSIHIGECHHNRPIVKGEDGVKVHDPKWGVDCDKCAPERLQMGWVDDILERPLTADEARKAKSALDRAHLTTAQSQNMLAEILAKLVAKA